jgi:hypothetical protein
MTCLDVPAAFADQDVFPFGGVVFEFRNGSAAFSQRRLLSFGRWRRECDQERSDGQEEKEGIWFTKRAHFQPPDVGWQDEPFLSLKKNRLFEVKGTNGPLLREAVSCWSRAAASNRTMKISASIPTTVGSRQSNTWHRYGTPFPPKNCDRQHTF